MTVFRIVSFGLGVFIAGPALAMQAAVIDLNAKTTPMTQSDYSEMLACTLENHPEKTRRYAEYHLQRRDVQTWQENKKDPDVGLLFPSLDGCHEIAMGKPFPFSLDKLISDWGEAHNVTSSQAVQVTDMKSLANCAAQYNADMARSYLDLSGSASSMKGKTMNMLLKTLTFPPCNVDGEIEIKHGKLAKLLIKALDKQRASK